MANLVPTLRASATELMHDASVVDVAGLIEAGEVRSADLTQRMFDHIAGVDGRLERYVTVIANQALAGAACADAKVLVDFVPDFDATIIAKLDAAGTALLGKLVLCEVAFGTRYPVPGEPSDERLIEPRIPWHLSSGQPAVQVDEETTSDQQV